MSLPIGHSFAALTIWTLAQPKGSLRPKWREGLLACCLANTPDFDFSVVWFLGWPIDAHRGPTHSIGFALLLGAGVALVRRWLGRTSQAARETLLWSAVIFSHVLLDLIAYDMAPPNRGIMVWWPFTTRRFLSSWTMYPVTFMDKQGWAMAAGVGLVLVMELALFGSLWLAALWWRARAWRGAAPVNAESASRASS